MEKIKTPVWMKLIVYIEDDCLLKLSRKLDVTYSHLIAIKKIFKEKKWITTKRYGRRKENKLTEKGKKMQDICRRMFGLIDEYQSIRH